uniref:Putative outer membrane efflux protein n=1 Tax=Magnetococcus massalia (strain MO-1) TaxID=451514 RepID=A0A1S7LH21_MAGMO|nr:Putative outer membrane efflux protein [Candidatus Magnetococcus massalia]
MAKKTMRSRVLIAAILFGAAATTTGSAAHAETLRHALKQALGSHDRIQAASADVKAGEARVDEKIHNSWYPTMEFSGHMGWEVLGNQDDGDATDLLSREFDVTIDQKVWDFGKTNAEIDMTRAQKQQLDAVLDSEKQNFVLESLTAFFNLKRSQEILAYAKQSVENIKRQGEVESVKISMGQGYTTDVLQVKAQLAGAQARVVQSMETLSQAENQIRSLFKRDPTEINRIPMPASPMSLIPTSMDEALDLAMRHNPQIEQMRKLTSAMESQRDSLRIAVHSPSIDGQVGAKIKEGVSGVDEQEKEFIAQLTFSMPINLGGGGGDGVRAAEQDLIASMRRTTDTQLQVEKAVRNSWIKLSTAKNRAGLLNEQANLAAKFLELAREERKMNKRTLLDVLNGETALINAKSDAASAEVDVKIAAYTLLVAMGSMELEVLNPGANLADLHKAPSKSEVDAVAKQQENIVQDLFDQFKHKMQTLKPVTEQKSAPAKPAAKAPEKAAVAPEQENAVEKMLRMINPNTWKQAKAE